MCTAVVNSPQSASASVSVSESESRWVRQPAEKNPLRFRRCHCYIFVALPAYGLKNEDSRSVENKVLSLCLKSHRSAP